MKKITLLLLPFFLGCSNQKTENQSIDDQKFPLSGLLNDCKTIINTDFFEVYDSINNIRFSLPNGWGTELVYEDGFHGIYAIDTVSFIESGSINTIQINSVKESSPLVKYFKSELKGLRDSKIPIEGIGEFDLDTFRSRWVLTSRLTDTGLFKDLLIYTNSYSKNTITIIHMSISESEDYIQRLCSFKAILNTILFERDMKLS